MVELLRTKIYIPRPRANLVARPHLTGRLNAGLEKTLTLIAAPAGFGKTTLLSEWIPTSPRCVTWLSLDSEDNDLTRFWLYLIASIQQVHPGLGSGALAQLQSPPSPPIAVILTSLINDIAAFPVSFAAVLDDYHVIEAQPIHESMAYLVAHLPHNLHLVITTRADPPLPAARLRARQELNELRANDLRFTAQEATVLLNRVMGLDLTPEDVSALERRTEGWIAGLQIAALSMQSKEDLPGFVRSFSGSHRHILEYLVDEVINQRPPGTLDFLLRTSILERLCGPLCDAVATGAFATDAVAGDAVAGDAAGGGPGGQEVLENLVQANLFITPLDDEGVWYRYHYLFAEALQARLRKSHPERLGELHGRASEWYAANGFMAEAVHHALAAGNLLWVADLIERERWALLGRGEASSMHRWLDRLPEEMVKDSPHLSLAYAWIFTLLRQSAAVEPRLQDAENALGMDSTASVEAEKQDQAGLRGEIATLRAGIALSQSDIPRALDLCRSALAQIPPENSLVRGFAAYYLAHGERRAGRIAQAGQYFAQSVPLSMQADNLLIALHALANLSLVQILMGRLRDAARTSQSILQVTADRRRQSWPVAGLAYYGLGKLYYEWNDLEAALQASQLGVEAGRRGGLAGLEFNCRHSQALTLLAQDDRLGAEQALGEIASLTAQRPHPVDAVHASVWEARIRLRQGQTEQAIRWADRSGLSGEDSDLPYSREPEYLTFARVRIAHGRSAGVLPLLDRLARQAESDGRTGSLIEILVVQALARQAGGDRPAALGILQRALALAEPEDYVRTFVDEGEPVRLLLVGVQSRIRQPAGPPLDDASLRLLAYTERLLAAFSGQAVLASRTPGIPLEPLSERELEVLRLVSTGLSNQEIADRLVIGLSTVKSHLNNLYGKLGTHRRTQAIVIAREVGLLPGNAP